MSNRILIEDNGAVFDLERGPKVLFGANVNRFREINELRDENARLERRLRRLERLLRLPPLFRGA